MAVFNVYTDGGDSIVHRIMLLTFKGKMQQSKAISSALTLHCYFDNNNNSVQQTAHKDVTENDAKSLSKASCLVALNMYLTLHLVLFRQST